MKSYTQIVSGILTLLCVTMQSCIAQSTRLDEVDSLKDTNERLRYRQDSSVWDYEMMAEDLEWVDEGPFGPFTAGIFPEPRYELNGEFDGIGNQGGQYAIGGKTILMNSFFVATGEGMDDSESYNEIYFHLLVLTDRIDTVNYTHASSIVISRNHPDYVGQGFYQTENNRIDYFAFTTQSGDSYAIINTRLFNLSDGQTILIAPQKDRTLRSMQLQMPQQFAETIDSYSEELLLRKTVREFFLGSGSIE